MKQNNQNYLGQEQVRGDQNFANSVLGLRRIKLAAKAAKLGIFEYRIKTGEQVWENDLMFEIFGMEVHEQPLTTLQFYREFLQESSRENFREKCKEAFNPPYLFNITFAICRKNDGSIRWLESTGEVLLDTLGKPMNIIGVLQDITAVKRREVDEQFLAEINQDLSHLSTAEEIMAKVGPKIGNHFKVEGCCYAEILGGEITILHGWQDPEKPSIDRNYNVLEHLSESFRKAQQKGVVVGIDSQESSSYIVNPIPNVLKHESFISAPFLRNGEWLGFISIGALEPRKWTDEDLNLVKEICNLVYPRIERARAQDVLRTGENQLRILTDSLPVLMSYLDKDLRYRFVNSRYTDWFGIKKEDVLGKHLEEVVGPEAFEAVQPYLKRVFAGETHTFEALLHYKNAGSRYVSVHYVPDFNSSGAISGYYALVQDITERKRQELNRAMLAEMSEELSQLTSVKDLVNAVGCKLGSYLSVSAFIFGDVFGAGTKLKVDYVWNPRNNAHNLKGVHYLNNFIQEPFLSQLQKGKKLVVRDIHTDPKTQSKPYKALDIGAFVVIPIVRNDELKYIFAVSTTSPRYWRDDEIDLLAEKSDRLCLRIERMRSELAIRESNERYRTLFDSVDEGFCICELIYNENGEPQDYLFLETNPAYGKLTGLFDAVGKTGRQLEPDLEEKWFKTYNRVVESGEALRFDSYLQAWDKWYDLYVTPIGRKEEKRFAILFSDITERKKSEAALIEADRRKNDFLATLAHELRNPLTPIKSGMDLLRDNDDEEIDLKTREIIERQVNKMVRLIDDLMDISRITRNKIRLQRKIINLHDAIEVAIETTRPLVLEANHNLRLIIPEDPIWHKADIDRIIQIITNLLTNAIKYTERGGEISLEVERVNNNAVVKVKDNGIGISSEQLEHIFEMFQQIEGASSRKQAGLGIGLSLVKNLVEMHNGTIKAYSKGENKGSEFVFTLPMVDNNIESLAIPAITKKSSVQDKKGMRVIVVDDNSDIADITKASLTRKGYDVKVGYSGAEAIGLLDSFSPNAAILDIGLPDMSGYELGQIIQKKFPDILLIALSGWGQAADKAKSKAAGFHHHLTKPSDLKEIDAILQSVSD